MKQLTFQNVYDYTLAQGQFTIGERGVTPDGRKWVYLQAATNTIKQGAALAPIATVTGAATHVSSSADNLGRIVYITVDNASWTTGQFANQLVVVQNGTGTGQVAKIKSNNSTTLTLFPENALQTALDSTSVIKIKYESVVDNSAVTSKLQGCVGISQISVPSAGFFWALTDGDGAVLTDDILTLGADFVTGGSVTGSVLPGTTAKGGFDEQNLGFCLVANNAGGDLALVRVAIR
jgi:hypothetical protein